MHTRKRDIRKLKQIPLRYDSLNEIRNLVVFLEQKGFTILHGLSCIKEDERIVAVVVDIEDKVVFTSNVTCMACWCNFIRYPLSIKQFYKYYDRLVIKKDKKFYNHLIEENMRERMMIKTKETLKKIYITIELIKENETIENIEKLEFLLNKLVLSDVGKDRVNEVWYELCTIINVVNRYPKLCNVVLRLKELQAYFIKNTFIENGILKAFPVSKIIEIPDNVKVICGDKEEKDLKEGRYGNDIFYNCFMNAKTIEEVYCPSTVESIGEKAFENCTSLNKFRFVKKGKNSLKKIGLLAFNNCSNLDRIELPNTLEVIDEYAFAGIPKLIIKYDGTLEEWNKIKKVGEWFASKTIVITKDNREHPIIIKEKNEKLRRLHRYCNFNRDLIKKSKKCYCFYCKNTIDAEDMLKPTVQYIDGGRTAICPKCGIDSILPDAIDEEITKEIINDMYEYWFK